MTGNAPETLLQRRILTIVLLLNIALVVSLTWTGILADSSGLIANAADNASDAAVYGLSLFAIGRAPHWKRKAAGMSGVLLLLFAGGVLADGIRRFLYGSEPVGSLMLWMAAVAAVVNMICLLLLRRLGRGDVNLRAVQTFSFNDFMSNGGIMVAGALVAWTGQRWPDLVVGFGVALVAARGGMEIIADARAQRLGHE